MTILCHVSNEKHDILIPQKPENAICFSEDKFVTYFGQYLYLFDLDVLTQNFNIRKVLTEGCQGSCFLHSEYHQNEVLKYKSQPLGYEWRIYEPVDVDRFALGVIEHWNHMQGIIGKGSVERAMTGICIDLMRYSHNDLLKLVQG